MKKDYYKACQTVVETSVIISAKLKNLIEELIKIEHTLNVSAEYFVLWSNRKSLDNFVCFVFHKNKPFCEIAGPHGGPTHIF